MFQIYFRTSKNMFQNILEYPEHILEYSRIFVNIHWISKEQCFDLVQAQAPIRT